jgi:predicted NUDIX family NTP pyrophosphohydrolase
MKIKRSAGILLYKQVMGQLFFLLVHPGGPFWKNKDIGAWSIPKGEFDEDENPLDAAIREFEEETGTLLKGEFTELVPVKLKSGKKIFAWASESEMDIATLTSNMFEMKWPPRSGKVQSFPEVDRAEWFTIEEALEKINPGQADLILQLVALLQAH